MMLFNYNINNINNSSNNNNTKLNIPVDAILIDWRLSVYIKTRMRLRATHETRPQYLVLLAVSVSAPVLSSEHCRSIKIKPKDLNLVLVNAGDQKNATVAALLQLYLFLCWFDPDWMTIENQYSSFILEWIRSVWNGLFPNWNEFVPSLSVIWYLAPYCGSLLRHSHDEGQQHQPTY